MAICQNDPTIGVTIHSPSFAPHRGYAFSKEPGAQVNEFKQMVKALHQEASEVILDVVFNHTCEGNERGPSLSFKGIENQVYYILNSGGAHYSNYTGCGNTSTAIIPFAASSFSTACVIGFTTTTSMDSALTWQAFCLATDMAI